MSGNDDLKALVDLVEAELETGDEERIAAAVDEVLLAVRSPPTEAEAARLFDALRSRKRFGDMARVADRFLELGSTEPLVSRQYGQALIELHLLEPAQVVLEKGLEAARRRDGERGELVGLLGRLHKQRFVRAAADRARGSDELVAAIRRYDEAYKGGTDPAWHGANLVALVSRAEREGIFAGGLKGEVVTRKVLEELAAREAREESHWFQAGIGEAYLGVGDFDSATRHYGRFIQHPKTDGFALTSAGRQLREIWEVQPGDDTPGGRILLALEATGLARPKGRLAYSPGDLQNIAGQVPVEKDRIDGQEAEGEQLQALIGPNAQLPLDVLLGLVGVTPAICRVVDRTKFERQIKSGGTGFLVDGGSFDDARAGQPLLVTNAHVLSEDGERPSVRRKDSRVVFEYWNGKKTRAEFDLKSILWRSPINDLDAAVAEVAFDDADNQPRTLCLANDEPEPLGPVGSDTKDKIYIIGHPDGRGIEFSLADNEVVDHNLGEDDEAAKARRRIHYGAATEGGSSGSPVFDERRFQVLGLHRAATSKPLRPRSGDYKANEAVWFRTIQERFGS